MNWQASADDDMDDLADNQAGCAVCREKAEEEGIAPDCAECAIIEDEMRWRPPKLSSTSPAGGR